MSVYHAKTIRGTSLADRLAKRLSPPNENGCILWTGAKNKGGYGTIGASGPSRKTFIVHRVAYELAYGSFDESLLVCHHCDVRLCCNPQHLFLGTHADNTADCVVKCRNVRGENHGCRKLNEASVRRIRDIYSKGISNYTDIAREFGISVGAIWCVVNRRNWKHI